MKKLPIYLICLIAVAAPASWADRHKTVDFARVTSATPVYRIVESRKPVKNCWTERVREERPVRHGGHAYHQAAAGTLVGGLVGSAVGHAIGHSQGHERTGTVIGAVVGASIGNNLSRNTTEHHTQVGYRNVQRCEVQHRVDKQRVLEGYDVTYRYHGRTYHTRTRNHPGKRLKVALTVRPLEH